MSHLLELRDVGCTLGGRPILQGVNLEIPRGQILGITGRSGSGKSTLARILSFALAPAAGCIRSTGPARTPRQLRRAHQLVIQDPGPSLRPDWPVWRIVTEPLALDNLLPAAALRAKADALLRQVRLPDPDAALRFPLQLSGGERRRVAIARALAARPDLLILDESLTGLDHPVRDSLLALLCELRDQAALGIVLISHDLRVLANSAASLAVLDEGRLVEHGAAAQVVAHPASPAARALVESAFWGTLQA